MKEKRNLIKITTNIICEKTTNEELRQVTLQEISQAASKS